MEKIINFRGAKIFEDEVKLLKELELLFGNKFNNVENYSKSEGMEFIVHNGKVFGIRVVSCKLKSKPNLKGFFSSIKEAQFNDCDVSPLLNWISNLKTLERLDLENCGLMDLPESISKLKSLSLLNLSENDFEELPDMLYGLKSLKKLDLYENPIEELPHNMGNFSSLEILELAYNKLTSLPESIGSIKSLKELSIKHNSITTFPDSIGNLQALEKLEIKDLTLKVLPESFGKLSSLKEVRISSGSIISLPKSIGNLQSLEKLDLAYSRLKDLPESFGKLSSLKELILSSNKLEKLPESIGNLVSLRKLVLKRNKLKTLPESFGNLTSLKELNLKENDLEILPESFGNLLSLNSIDLTNNKLKTLPNNIDCLNNFTDLNLKNNNLETLPDSIGSLRSLENLYLDFNHLTGLPETISGLKSLKRLVIANNLLVTLPETIGELQSLETLYLENNLIEVLPESIGNLSKLKLIYLYNNRIKLLPKSIGNLSSLQYLSIGTNELRNIPESIGNLSELKELKLKWNKINTLPESISNLQSLQKLMLGNNKLKVLPEIVCRLNHLEFLGISLNDFDEIDLTPLNNCLNLDKLEISPSVKLFWSGTELPKKKMLIEGLQNYFTRLILKEKISETSMHLIQRLKIFCVGVGGGGKTSLLRILQNKEYLEGRDSTIGLDINTIVLNGDSKDGSQEIIWWDYGGQSGYLPTHRFFFTRDAIYILVFRADHDIEQNKLFEWITSIRGRAPFASIIPIATWSDRMKRGGRSIIEGTQGKELSHLFSEFDIKDTPILVSNKEKDNKGIGVVRLKLETLLQETGSTYQVPKGYMKIEEFVRKLKNKGLVFMNRKEFLERLENGLIESGWEGVKSSWLQRMGIYQLHEHGIIFYTNELFPASDLVIVNVDQANKVLATIIDEVEVFMGVVGVKELRHILEEKCPFIIDSFKNLNQVLDLLGELGLAYRDLSANMKEETWIFPLYLTKTKTEWQDIENSWKEHAYSKASFTLKSVDETLFSRLLYQLSFNGQAIGIWLEKKVSERKDIHHALITLNQNLLPSNLSTPLNTQGLAINFVTYHHNKRKKEFTLWFNEATPAIETMVFETCKRYLRQEYHLISSNLAKIKEREGQFDSKIAKDIYDKVAKDYLFLNEKLDRQFYHFNAELRKIIVDVEDLQIYIDNNIDRLKEFISQIQKKLPLPTSTVINKKYFGIKKELSLYFTCGSQKKGCSHSKTNAFIIKTKEWNKWIKISLSAVKIGINAIKLDGGDIMEEIQNIKELKEVYDDYKGEEFPDFLSFAREPFLVSSERDDLIENLRDNNFFKSFEYEPISAKWICNNCASKK
ncbi:MAG: leucine-rich repeat protein [Candidatus Lokiarchaeota archaeon]|nr:leucine-rich repeat protein [Candidatus Lokiarchaeota archaeon]